MKYIITGLPRSRTTWFSEYLTSCGSRCIHDGLNGCGSLDEYLLKMQDYEGNSDSTAMFHGVDVPTVIIYRNKRDVEASVKNVFGVDTDFTPFLNKMDEINGLRVNFDDINKNLPEIHDFIGVKYDQKHAEQYIKKIIKTDELFMSDDTSRLLGELLCH